MTMHKLESGIQRLVETNRYYGEMLQRMKRKKAPEIPTYGVSYQDGGVVLWYNPYWHDQFTIDQLAGVLEHECSHIMNDHFTREKELEPEFDRQKALKEGNVFDQVQAAMTGQTLNICEDVAINQWINRIPETFHVFDKEGNVVIDEREEVVDEKSLKKYLNRGFKINNPQDLQKFMIPNDNFGLPAKYNACTLKSFRKMIPDNTKLLDKQPFEYYYNLLKEHGGDAAAQAAGAMQEILSTLDTHEMEGKGGDKEVTDPEVKKEMAKQLCNEAAKAAKEHDAGSIPHHIEQLLEAMNKRPKNWKKDVSKFVAKASSIYKEITKNRRNRRQRKGEPLVPGYRNKTALTLVWAVDNSGSMNDQVMEQIAAEGKRLHDMGIRLYLIQCDTVINDMKEYRGEKIFTRTGDGGTVFNPVFEFINSGECRKKFGDIDGMIFFTDGGCWESPDEVIKPKCPILWAMTEGCRCPVNWGWVTEVIIREK